MDECCPLSQEWKGDFGFPFTSTGDLAAFPPLSLVVFVSVLIGWADSRICSSAVAQFLHFQLRVAHQVTAAIGRKYRHMTLDAVILTAVRNADIFCLPVVSQMLLSPATSA